MAKNCQIMVETFWGASHTGNLLSDFQIPLSKSPNFEAKINYNTTTQNVPKWRKKMHRLKILFCAF